MVQRSNMWYAYFRFYVDEDDIRIGLDTYCKEWENMFAVGYNYKEYKCFVDNLGGFEHWVGDMSGYISQTREIGFMDGAPSDTVFDASLLMGKSKIEIPDMRYLHYLKPPFDVTIRKVDALAAGSAKLKSIFTTGESFSHSFYYAYDEQKIERFTYTKEIKDSSSGITSCDITADLSKVIPTHTIDPASNTTNPGNAIDGSFSTYTDITAGDDKSVYIDLGSVQDVYNICFKYYLQADVGDTACIYAYYGDTVAGATNAIMNDCAFNDDSKTVDYFNYGDMGISARFIRFRLYNVTGGGMARLYQALIS